MAIRDDRPDVTEHELQYARRVLKVLAALIEQGDPEVRAALLRIGWALYGGVPTRTVTSSTAAMYAHPQGGETA